MSSLKHERRVEAESDLVSSHFGPIEFKENWILVYEFNLPRTFNRKTSKLLIIMPYNYPESPVKDMYLEKGLKKNGKTPEHYFEGSYGDSNIMAKGYAWYSIHFTSWSASSMSMIRGDNLLTAINALYDALKFDER